MSNFLKYNNHMVLHPTDSSKYIYGIAVDPYNPLVLPPFTIRCKFASGYTPTVGDSQTLVDPVENIWDITKNSTDWSSLLRRNESLIEVLGANSTGVVSMASMLAFCSISTIPLFDTSSCTSMASLFAYCSTLDSVPLFNTSSCLYMSEMFIGCTSLVSVPLFDTSSCASMNRMFSGCTSLTSVPLFDTSSCSSIPWMFNDCYNVQSGALALYLQVSTQANPPTTHINTFNNCGRDTVTGLAELQQIPESWGGLSQG